MKSKGFCTRQDYLDSLAEMCSPLKKYYSEGRAHVLSGDTAAHYGKGTMGLEGFSRILWGLVPLWAGGGESCLDGYIIEGIRHGTDPSHAEYWGQFKDGEQGFVEMAALALGLWITPAKIWDPLSQKEKDCFREWLYQINTAKISDNNWLFFRVLVNCGLKAAGTQYCQSQLETDLNRIDEFYLGDGWYSDGATAQRDYYIGFAMHFYGLIYAALMEKEDKERSVRFKSRARLFAQEFVYWFGERGEALPYGRSLTYRFAQGSFWCALAFAGVDALPWGVIKGIINRHFRHWFSLPILDAEDKLTLGYAYPNLHMCEGYNAPNSPYWAWKSYLLLALPREHPLWQAQEMPFPQVKALSFQKYPGMLIQRGEDGYVTALASGQYAEWEPVHCGEKYGKFAYSSYFGFQVPRSYYGLNQAVPDNMLAFERDGYYFIRRRCISVKCENDKIWSSWSPLKGIKVETELVPLKSGHMRTHTIQAQWDCMAVEGGFSLPEIEPDEVKASVGEKSVILSGAYGSSRLELIEGSGEADYVLCEANVNVLHSRTLLPYIRYEIKKGITVIRIFVEGCPNIQDRKEVAYEYQESDL